MSRAYHRLEERAHEISSLRGALGILSWDAAVMMPKGGSASRGEQLATLEGIVHERLTGPEVCDWLDEAEVDPPAGEWQIANLRELRRLHTLASALDRRLVEATARAVNDCEMRWRQARETNDFSALRPLLEEVLHLKREAGQARGEQMGLSPYDALMEEFEPGARCAWIDPLFDDLASFLPEVLPRILDAQARQGDALPFTGGCPAADQEALGRRLMRLLGFDFEHGRLDTSTHPFCGGTPDDVRITTRYEDDGFLRSLMGVLHETGHGQYERGLPTAWRHQPVGHARGMALHESQSLIVEMQACRSREFISFLAPLAREAFGASGPAWEVSNLLRHVHHVERGFIRVDADEVTYPAHVILRYRLEARMIAGTLDIADLPDAWDHELEGLLGLRAPDHRRGCLQDIHWPSGGWGYFPSYTLGALSAAQLFAAMQDDHPALLSEIATGQFETFFHWLRTKVHSRGSSVSTQDILREATGAGLATTAYKRHVQRRYLDA